MKFYHMQGCGNKFVIFDGRGKSVYFDASAIVDIAGPDNGANVDQVILIEDSLAGAAFMRIWNRDGSEVSACGNATRCVAWLLLRESGKDALILETAAGLLSAERHGANQIAVDMGVPLLRWEEIPLAERMDTRCLDLKLGPIDAPVLHSPGAVNIGNPHVVFFVADVEQIDIRGVGPMIEGHILFPERANVGFAQILSHERLRLKVWERGAGLTLACGSGACAAVIAACRRGLSGRSAEVLVDGGSLSIEWREHDDHVIMTGPIELLASGEAASCQDAAL